MPRPLQKSDLVQQLNRLGLQPDTPLLLHTSYRAVRPIAGGPETLIAALREALGPHGTLVTPAWTGNDDRPFDPATTPCDPDLGILPELFRQIPGVTRSPHPFAFAAIGPHAGQIHADPLPIPPHCHASPVGRIHDLDGQILLLGVDHDVNTTLHLAETLAQVPYSLPHHVTILRDGRPNRIDYREPDHCTQRFRLANNWLRARNQQSEGPVGHAQARLFRSRHLVAAALEHLREDPFLFLHEFREGCAECNAARASLTTKIVP